MKIRVFSHFGLKQREMRTRTHTTVHHVGPHRPPVPHYPGYTTTPPAGPLACTAPGTWSQTVRTRSPGFFRKQPEGLNTDLSKTVKTRNGQKPTCQNCQFPDFWPAESAEIYENGDFGDFGTFWRKLALFDENGTFWRKSVVFTVLNVSGFP